MEVPSIVTFTQQHRAAVTAREIDPDLPVSVQESPTEVWVGGGLLQGRGH